MPPLVLIHQFWMHTCLEEDMSFRPRQQLKRREGRFKLTCIRITPNESRISILEMFEMCEVENVINFQGQETQQRTSERRGLTRPRANGKPGAS